MRTIGVQPSEFWDMTLPEIMLEIDRAGNKSGGKPRLTDDDRAMFQSWLEEDGK